MKKSLFKKSILLSFLGVVSAFMCSKQVTVKAERLYSWDEILTPFWEGDTVYNETITVIEEQNGRILPISLIYDIKEVLSVKSATLTTTYSEGTDYYVEDGKFVVKPSGKIPHITYSEFHPTTGTDGFEDVNGGYVCWKEGAWYHNRQIVITYTHEGTYEDYILEKKGDLLPKLQEKLKNKQDINLLVYGDSISTGGNSSGHPQINVSPWMPIYPDMFVEGLKRTYDIKVNVYNEAVGGTDSNWGVANISTIISAKYKNVVDFDLAIVAFGMNDTVRTAVDVSSSLNRICTSLTKLFKNCEILNIATMIPNPNAPNFYGHQAEFYDEMVKYEKEGIATIDITGMHKSLLRHKRFVDMTGNNINHANDFLARVYATSLLRSVMVPPKNEPATGNTKGCGGSIGTISALITLSSMCGIIPLINKRRKYNEEN